MDFKNSIYWRIYGDVWSVHKKYFDIQESDEYWDNLISEGTSVYKKYADEPEGEFAKQLVFCVLDELQRRYEDLKKQQQIIEKRNRGVIPLSDVKWCPNALNFYDKFRGPIADIRTLAEGDEMMRDLERDCERYSKAYPNEKEEIEETYRLLKKKCLESMKELKEEMEYEQCYKY